MVAHRVQQLLECQVLAHDVLAQVRLQPHARAGAEAAVEAAPAGAKVSEPR
jgi:hypothetical protein